jgi:hypothetical protein
VIRVDVEQPALVLLVQLDDLQEEAVAEIAISLVPGGVSFSRCPADPEIERARPHHRPG